MSTNIQPLVPRSGSTLSVIALGRISTIHQDVENIDASYRYIQDYLHKMYSGPLSLKLLGEQASGMRTDRATIREAEELIASGSIDLVIAEDLGRIYRNPRYQFDFVQNAVDAGTRVICIGDNLDTADENWEVTMGAAALRHGLHIPDTRRRVRRTATHAFHRGGMVLKIRYGYRKLNRDEAATGDFGPVGLRIAKRDDCTSTIQEIARRVIRGDPYASVSDWLNAEGIVPGDYVKRGRWTPSLIADLLADPILAGVRTFRDTICQPIFRTGRHRTSVNSTPESKHYPQLAHLTSDEFATVTAAMAERRRQLRTDRSKQAKRRGVPRSRTLWPGQSASCAVCGGILYYIGSHLRCSNSLPRNGARCWNRVQLPAAIMRERLVTWLTSRLPAGSPLRQRLVEVTWEFYERSLGLRQSRNAAAGQAEALRRQAANLSAAIAAGGEMLSLVQRLKSVEASLAEVQAKSSGVEVQTVESGVVQSQKDFEAHLPEALLHLTGHSFEMARLLRQLVPQLTVHPVQALDTRQVRPRAKLKVSWQVLESGDSPGAPDELLAFDCFTPPAHIRAARDCCELRKNQPTLSQRKVAALLHLNVMTCKRACDYARRMELVGSDDPYFELKQSPNLASRWRLAK